MRTLLKIIGAIILLSALSYAGVMFLTSGERDMAKSFVTLASSGQHAEAHALLHSAMRREYPLERFAELFAGVQPYTEISFGSVETGTSGTRLSGSASTESGCSSQVSVDILDDVIIAFDITPLCRE